MMKLLALCLLPAIVYSIPITTGLHRGVHPGVGVVHPGVVGGYHPGVHTGYRGVVPTHGGYNFGTYGAGVVPKVGPGYPIGIGGIGTDPRVMGGFPMGTFPGRHHGVFGPKVGGIVPGVPRGPGFF